MAEKELPAKESLKLGIISLLIFSFLYFSNPNQGHDYVNNFNNHTLSILNNTSEANIVKQGILGYDQLYLSEVISVFTNNNGFIIGYPSNGIGVVNNDVFNQAVEEGVIKFTSEPKDVKLKHDIFHLNAEDLFIIRQKLLSDGHHCYIFAIDNYTLRRINITFMFTNEESKKYKSWEL